MPASLARPPATPPERLAAGPLVLRRVEADDAAVVAVAIVIARTVLRPAVEVAEPVAEHSVAAKPVLETV